MRKVILIALICALAACSKEEELPSTEPNPSVTVNQECLCGNAVDGGWYGSQGWIDVQNNCTGAILRLVGQEILDADNNTSITMHGEGFYCVDKSW